MTETLVGIADVAEETGLSKDTLRWYEKEGLLPSVHRSSSGYRAYTDADRRMVGLVLRLRRTGMPVKDVRRFVDMVEEGASTHGRRMALLTEHRQRVLRQLDQLHTDLGTLDDKIAHYDGLIDAGLDCTEQPITDPDVLARQRRLA